MKLYDGGRAPNPRRVSMFLAEKGIEVEKVPVDMGQMGHKSAEVTKLNPLQRLPVLVLDDGTVLTESVAICRYFEELHPDPPLFGTGAKEKAIVEMWLRRVELNLMVPIGMVWVHGHPLTAKLIQQIPEAAAQNRVRTAMGYKLLNDQLARHAFIAGDTYTVADAVALATVDFGAGLVGVPPDAALTHLDRWHQAVTARPSAKA
jgi:glutathione S-transferase